MGAVSNQPLLLKTSKENDATGPARDSLVGAIFHILCAVLGYLSYNLKKLLAMIARRSSAVNLPSPVQVYVLLGQSNMVGMGKIHGKNEEGTLEFACRKKHLYPYLIDSDGNWTTFTKVRNVRVMDGRGAGEDGYRVYHNEFMTVRGDTIGPELGIGHCLEEGFEDTPILILKSCIGNRSLGWDLLPPGSERFEYNNKTYAGYGESPSSWPSDQPKPDPMSWYAGKQYDSDVSHAKNVLSQLDKYYPDATSYEVAGFFWWQGDKDRYDMAYATQYEKNLVELIKRLRLDFDAPQAKFVLATLGQTSLSNPKGAEKPILEAMLAVDGNSGKYPEFRGNVCTVYAHPLSRGGASNSHYSGNAETYMNVGEALGRACVEISTELKAKEQELLV